MTLQTYKLKSQFQLVFAVIIRDFPCVTSQGNPAEVPIKSAIFRYQQYFEVCQRCSLCRLAPQIEINSVYSLCSSNWRNISAVIWQPACMCIYTLTIRTCNTSTNYHPHLMKTHTILHSWNRPSLPWPTCILYAAHIRETNRVPAGTAMWQRWCLPKPRGSAVNEAAHIRANHTLSRSQTLPQQALEWETLLKHAEKT